VHPVIIPNRARAGRGKPFYRSRRGFRLLLEGRANIGNKTKVEEERSFRGPVSVRGGRRARGWAGDGSGRVTCTGRGARLPACLPACSFVPRAYFGRRAGGAALPGQVYRPAESQSEWAIGFCWQFGAGLRMGRGRCCGWKLEGGRWLLDDVRTAHVRVR
jgi:hypothetical protein